MTDETITRARAAVARLREVEGKATAGPWQSEEWDTVEDESGFRVALARHGEDAAAIVALRNAAPALLALADRATALIEADDRLTRAVLTGSVYTQSRDVDLSNAFGELRAALADLAALAGDADAGEVGDA